MLKLLVYVLFVNIVSGLTCPPSCEPARKSDCNEYTKHAACRQDVKDISSSEAHCGCLWQAYIQSIEPAARVIFTREGKLCYVWASKACSILENNIITLLKKKNSPKRPKTTVFRNSHDLECILRRIQTLESIQSLGRYGKGIAKKRRRNGVGILSNDRENLLNKGSGTRVNSNSKTKRHASEEFIGKPGKSGTASWVEVFPDKQSKAPAMLRPTYFPPKMDTPNTVKNVYTIRQHWIDVDMPVDQFKLGVFMVILLLNILVVLVLIFCKGSDRTKKQYEAKTQAGDLNADIYSPEPPDSKSGKDRRKMKKSPLSTFIDSCRKKMHKDKKKDTVSTQYLQMVEVSPEEFTKNANAHSKRNSQYVDTGMYQSPQRMSRGLYDSVVEEMEGLLDNTYEEPLSSHSTQTEAREFHKRNYSLRSDTASEDDSPLQTKYYPRESEASNKSVSFSLSPRTYLTLQDRMVVHPSSRRKRRSKKGLTVPFKMTK